MDLQAVRATTERIARDAGATIMRYFEQPHEEMVKANIFDIATEGDRESERVIVAALREAFPDHHIVSEESGGLGAPADEAEYFWHIDPIDGTVNFARDLPFFSVSIAMTDRSGQPLAGVVYNPVSDEMFSAARGGGAALNGRPLRVTTTPALQQSVLASGFSTDKVIALQKIHMWEVVLPHVRDLRRFASAALELCFVAAGRLDGYWEDRLHGWDILAGVLCVTEAGGQVSDYSGTLDRLYTGAEIVASNGRIHDDLLALLRQSLPE